MPQFKCVRKFRIEVGVAAEKVAVVAKGHKGTQFIVSRPSYPSAIPDLQGILVRQLIGKMHTGKQIGILARIGLVGLLQGGFDVR